MAWMEALGAGLEATGTGISAYYMYESGRRQEKIYHKNAEASEDYAEYLKQLRERKLKILAKQTEEVVGAQKVGYARAGVRVGTGTTYEMEKHTRTEAELDAIAIREDAEYEVTRLYDVAAMQRKMGRWAEEGSQWRAAATIMAGAAGMIESAQMPYFYEYIR